MPSKPRSKPREAPQEAADPLADLRATEPTEGPENAPDALPEADPDDGGEPRTVTTVVAEAVGGGSTCWVGGTGDLVFDPDQAMEVTQRAVAELATMGVGQPLATDDDVDAQVAEMIAAWHADTVSLGFLHGGGRCGCRYLARTALRVTKPGKPQED